MHCHRNARRIDDILKERRLTQAAAARVMGISQPDVSKMQRGLFRGFSLERLLAFLAAFGQDVTIDVRRRTRGKAESIRNRGVGANHAIVF